MNVAVRKIEEEKPPEQPLHVAERMANVMIDCMYQKRTWKVEDLRAANFSLNDIARYLPAACDLVEKRNRPSQR